MRDAVYYPDDDDDAREDAREDGATTTTRAGATTTTTTTIATGDASEGDGKARATIATGAREGGGSYTTPGVVPPVMPTRLVSARTYESEPARGTPVSAIETRPRPQTIARAQGGVFAFVSPMFADMSNGPAGVVRTEEPKTWSSADAAIVFVVFRACATLSVSCPSGRMSQRPRLESSRFAS